MSATNLRSLRPLISKSSLGTSGMRCSGSLTRHARFLSARKSNPLTASRPEMQPQTRRKHLQESSVPLYPRIEKDPKFLAFAEVKARYADIEAGAANRDEVVTIRGRVKNYRDVSSKLIFYDLAQDGEKLQAVFNWKNVGGDEEEFVKQSMMTRVGDIVSITGHPGRTKAGELSIIATSHMQLLSPCLHVPPTEILDPEKRLQNRHVDLIIRPEASQILRLRSHIVQFIRNKFLSRDFIEVQTPVLSDNAGGAIAKPFLTEASAYKGKKLALRIAPELWLKRLVIGGMDRVFEIGTQFRNEGLDHTHNPEFTTCEFYQAYAGLEELISFTEELLQELDAEVSKLKETKYTNLEQLDLDFRGPFRRIEFIPDLEKAMGRTLPAIDDVPEDEATRNLLQLLKDLDIPVPDSPTLPRILDKLSGVYLEPQCVAPTFITHHPESLSPLAKTSIRNGRRVTERVELFIAGKEIVNAYEEENSPVEQRRKFLMQARWRDDQNSNRGEEERECVDEGYCVALEWGLPPTGGWGLGVDRVCMLFSGVEKIGDVLCFGGLRGAVNQGGARKEEAS
ncbi:mitochondrial lysine-tRNA synthetase [Rhizina undulata]